MKIVFISRYICIYRFFWNSTKEKKNADNANYLYLFIYFLLLFFVAWNRFLFALKTHEDKKHNYNFLIKSDLVFNEFFSIVLRRPNEFLKRIDVLFVNGRLYLIGTWEIFFVNFQFFPADVLSATTSLGPFALLGLTEQRFLSRRNPHLFTHSETV